MPVELSPDRFSAISSVNETVFETQEHYGPVTALYFYENFLLCGYGPILKIFQVDQDQFKPIWSKQIFKRNKIHCISVSPDGTKVVAAGARSFCVLQFPLSEESNIIEKRINEWITTTEFLDNDTLLILNSHNTVYNVNVADLQTQKFKITDYIHCNEKSILYSGSIRVSGARCIVAAGTVMDGVIVWDLNTREILYKLTDHKGSIFGVKIDQKFEHLISCSDDRSIKLYNFLNGELLAEGWGHGSRIWNLDFFETPGSIQVMSAGEDCTVRFWTYSDTEKDLQQTSVIEDCHLGKHVWSSSIDAKKLNLAASGGADGRIRLHDLSSITNSPANFSMEEISVQIGCNFSKKEVIKDYAYLSKLDLLVAVTSLGKIITMDQATNTWRSIDLSEQESNTFTNFSIIRGLDQFNTVFVISREGNLLQLDFESGNHNPVNKEWTQIEQLAGNKVTNLLVASENASNGAYLLIDCPNAKIPFIVKHFKYVDGKLQVQQEIELSQPDQTSFTTTCMLYDEINNWLVVCSRYSSICVFDLENECQLFKKITPGDTITSVESVSVSKGKNDLLITVRDGVYAIVSLTKDDKFNLKILHQNKIARGFVEGGYFHGQDLILYGFRSNYFYVWNETKQLEIANELCGGAHRKWELFRNGDAFKFVYLSKTHISVLNHAERFVDSTFGLVRDGTHGREVRDVSIAPHSERDNTKLLLTASEDTFVRLGKLSSDGVVKNYWCMNDHISGLQRVKFLSSDFAASSAANEEFFIWKISRDDNGTPLMCRYAYLETSAEIPDLRIMDFVSIQTDAGFYICTVYSDSSIKLYEFDISTKKFNLKMKDSYTTCCLLNVEFLNFGGSLYLMTAATDGHIAIWSLGSNADELGKPIIRQQLHQSGIKSFAVQQKNEGYKLITGGDDNSLILSSLWKDGAEIKFQVEDFTEVAASATITSVSLATEDRIVVTSVDQIVRLWSFSEAKLHCLGARYTTVADTGCSDVTEMDGKNIAVVGGAGISTWRF